MKYLIFLLFLVYCESSWATTQVVQYFTHTPVSVCQPSDSNTNCGSGGGGGIGVGTVNAGTMGQTAYYATSSSAVSGNSNLIFTGTGSAFNQGNVGISTSSAIIAPLEVWGQSYYGGNVGVFTVNPGAQLDVQGTTRSINMVVSGNVGVGTTFINGVGEAALTVMNGNVGIGTWTPKQLLAVGSTGAFNVTSSGALTAQSASISAGMNVQGSSNFSQSGANFPMTVLGNVGIGTTLFNAGLAVMNGNVGIGTWNPQAALHIVGGFQIGSAGNTWTNAGALGTSGNITGGGNFRSSSTAPLYGSNNSASGVNTTYIGSAAVDGFSTIESTSGVGTTDYTRFLTSSQIERARIDTNGNLGIGTSIPVGYLDVEGTLRPAIFFANGNTPQQNVGIGSASPGQRLDVKGTVRIPTLGSTLSILTGTNSCQGTGTLTGGTATISTACTPSSSTGIHVQDTGGGVLANIGALYIGTVVAGTSFVVTSSNALDSSNFSYIIFGST